MSERELKPIVLLRDVPTPLEHDEFVHRSYVDVLAAALRDGRQPMTIGLFGPWGVGKSSVLLALQKDLQSPDCAVVRFDAWRYDGDTLRRQLLRDVATELKRQKALPWHFRLKRRLVELDMDVQQTSVRVRPSLGGLLTALVQTVVVAVAVLIALSFDAIEEAIDLQDPSRGTLLTVAVGFITFAGTVAGQFLRPLPVTRTHKRTEDPERFHDVFRTVVRNARRKRIVIAIDNLDRTSPDVALELLSTIKTYLEPAAEEARSARWRRTPVATEVLYLIAVDYAALLAHTRTDPEYLRKIFTGVVTMVPLHRDDLRGYALKQLEQIGGLGLSDEARHQLASLLDAALGTTPRQIIQFLNNLALVLQLVAERESGRARALAQPISDYPLVIAKLALIRDRWPDHYAAIVKSPQQLDIWHAQAVEPTASLGLDGEFAAFLRVSYTIKAPNLRPFLEIRQAQAEHDLPEFAAFRVALTTANRAEVREILDRAGTQAHAYVQRLDDVFEEEVLAGYMLGARCVMDIALTDPRLGPANPMTHELLLRVLNDPRFSGERDALPATPYLEAALGAGLETIDVVARELVRRLSTQDLDGILSASIALARYSRSLDPGIGARIADATSTTPLRHHLPALARLVAADPAWLSPVAANELVNRLADATLLLSGEGAEDAVAVFSVIARAAHLADASRPLIAALEDNAAVTVANAESLANAVEVALALESAHRSARAVVESWTDELPNLDDDAAPGAARAMWPVARLHARALEGVLGVLGADREFVRTHFSEVPHELRPVAVEAIVAAGGLGGHELFHVIEADELTPDTARTLARAWAREQVPFERIMAMLEGAGAGDGGSPTPAAVAVWLAEEERQEAAAVEWLSLAVEHGLTADLEVRAAALLRQMTTEISALDPATFAGILKLAGSLTASESTIVSALADNLRANLAGLGLDHVAELFAALGRRETVMDPEARASLRRESLRRWDGAPAQRATWARAMRDLGGLDRASEADLLVDDILRLERTAGVDARIALLTLGAELVGPAPALLNRFQEISASTKRDDRAVAPELPRL